MAGGAHLVSFSGYIWDTVMFFNSYITIVFHIDEDSALCPQQNL